MSKFLRAADGSPLLSLRSDVNEERGISALGALTTVGDIRAGLVELAAWARGSEREADWCMPNGSRAQMLGWIARSEHLLRKLPNASLPVEVPSAALEAFDEVSSYGVQLAALVGVPAAGVPHLAEHLPGA